MDARCFCTILKYDQEIYTDTIKAAVDNVNADRSIADQQLCRWFSGKAAQLAAIAIG